MILSSTPTMILWAVVMLSQAVLSILLIRQRAWKSYPCFCAYIFFCTFKSPALLAFLYTTSADAYIAGYAVGMVVSFALQVFVIAEMVCDVFRPFDVFPGHFARNLLAALILVVTVAVALSTHHPSVHDNHWLSLLRTANRSLTFVIAGCAGFVVIFSAHFGVYWRKWVYGIGVGLLFNVSVALATSTMISVTRGNAVVAERLIQMASFVVALFVWSGYFVGPDSKKLVLNLEQAEKVVAHMHYLRYSSAILTNTLLDRAEDGDDTCRSLSSEQTAKDRG